MRWSHTQRNGSDGRVKTIPTHATHCQVHALAARIHMPRRTPPMRLDMVEGAYRIPHRRARCQHWKLCGLEKSIHNLRRHDHEPVGGEWLSPPHKKGMTALRLRLSHRWRQLSQIAFGKTMCGLSDDDFADHGGPSGPQMSNAQEYNLWHVERPPQRIQFNTGSCPISTTTQG